MKIEKYKNTKFYALYDDNSELICVAVYKRGAEAVAKRLAEKKTGE